MHEPLPKVSGIAVDLYFDHLLAKNWSRFHGVHLSQFVEAFYTATPKHHSFESKQYKFMIAKMKEMNWLYNYRTHEGLTYACSGLSKRISFDNLLHKAPDVYLENEALITDTFHRFMAEAIPYFEDYFLWIKVFLKGGKFHNLQEYLVNMNVDNNFFKRRSGLNYLKFYYNFVKILKYRNIITWKIFLFNLMVRTSVILMPILIIKKMYKFFLRN